MTANPNLRCWRLRGYGIDVGRIESIDRARTDKWAKRDTRHADAVGTSRVRLRNRVEPIELNLSDSEHIALLDAFEIYRTAR